MFINHIRKSGLLKQIIVISVLFQIGFSSSAQDSVASKQKWKFLADVYMMFPNMKGSVGAGTLPDADLDVDAGDIFSHFKMGTMLYAEAVKGSWAISSDLIYMKLAQDVTPGILISSGKVTVKQTAWEAAGLRNLLPWLDAGIGFRLNSLSTDVELLTKNIGGSTTARNKSIAETWVDPILIARIKSDPTKKFIYQFRGDIGGFGIGSDLAWQIQAYAGYRFSKLFQLTGGYRLISVDYGTGSNENRFLYDVDTFGPVIRFGFNF